jgi:hypothetical protein
VLFSDSDSVAPKDLQSSPTIGGVLEASGLQAGPESQRLKDLPAFPAFLMLFISWESLRSERCRGNRCARSWSQPSGRVSDSVALWNRIPIYCNSSFQVNPTLSDPVSAQIEIPGTDSPKCTGSVLAPAHGLKINCHVSTKVFKPVIPCFRGISTIIDLTS